MLNLTSEDCAHRGSIPRHNGGLLSPVLLSKLPSDARLIGSREKPEGDWTLDDLLKTLEREVGA